MATLEQLELSEALERLFARKREDFLSDFGVEGHPALTLQCCPVESLSVDVRSAEVRTAFQDGGGPLADDGWWCGFKVSGLPVLAFDGIASSRADASSGWATQLHVDGHLTAGIWGFPAVPEGTGERQSGVCAFHVDAFRDFAHLVHAVLKAADCATAVRLTATLHQANRLPLLVDSGRVLVPAPKRTMLRWPIATVPIDALSDASAQMAARFFRIYGKTAPKQG